MDATQLRDWCLRWPGTEAAPKWGDDLVFTVAGKMFCVLCTHGPDAGRISLKVGPERFLEYTDRPGFRPAPYLARAYWVTLDHPSAQAPDEVRQLLRTSYERVRAGLPKVRQRALAD